MDAAISIISIPYIVLVIEKVLSVHWQIRGGTAGAPTPYARPPPTGNPGSATGVDFLHKLSQFVTRKHQSVYFPVKFVYHLRIGDVAILLVLSWGIIVILCKIITFAGNNCYYQLLNLTHKYSCQQCSG